MRIVLRVMVASMHDFRYYHVSDLESMARGGCRDSVWEGTRDAWVRGIHGFPLSANERAEGSLYSYSMYEYITSLSPVILTRDDGSHACGSWKQAAGAARCEIYVQ